VQSEGVVCDSVMLGWSGGAAGVCVQVPEAFNPGDDAPASKPRLDGGVTVAPVENVKSDKEIKAEEKAKRKAELVAKRASKKMEKEAAKNIEAGGDDSKEKEDSNDVGEAEES